MKSSIAVLTEAMTTGVQLAYLTNDTEAAIEQFETRLGIGPWLLREAPFELVEGPAGAKIGSIVLASFAYMPGRMFELVQPLGDASPIFSALPASDFVIVPHHVGAYGVHDSDAVKAGAMAAGFDWYRLAHPRGDIMFVDTRATLGHWLELLCFEGQSISQSTIAAA